MSLKQRVERLEEAVNGTGPDDVELVCWLLSDEDESAKALARLPGGEIKYLDPGDERIAGKAAKGYIDFDPFRDW